jgi:hypothetical protein
MVSTGIGAKRVLCPGTRTWSFLHPGGRRRPTSGPRFSFLGKAVGSVHENLKYWESTFEKDNYVLSILKHGYKIPVKMTDVDKGTRYRERNNQSANDNMDFVRAKVDRLLKDGQIIKSERPVRCTNPLTVASKVNADRSIKKRLVIDLSRWVNGFIKPDHFKMARFQDALDQLAKGDYQSVFDISKAYHHLRLHPESYELVGFCVTNKSGKEHFYHYVVVVFGLGPAGQALGRVMWPLLAYLASKGIRNMMYVDEGRTAASTKAKADSDYKFAIGFVVKAGFTVAIEKSDKFGDSAQRKEYLDFIIDTSNMTLYVPKKKLSSVLGLLGDFMKKRRPSGTLPAS